MRYLKSFHHIRNRIILFLTALMIFLPCLSVNIYAATDWSRFMQPIDGYYQNGFWNIYRPGLLAVRFPANDGDYDSVTLTEDGQYVICYKNQMAVSRMTISNRSFEALPAYGEWCNGKIVVSREENEHRFRNIICCKITVHFLENGSIHSVDNVLTYTAYANGVFYISLSEDAQYFCLWKSDISLSAPLLIHRASVNDFNGVPWTRTTPNGRIYIVTDSSAKALVFDEDSFPGSHYKYDADIQDKSLTGSAFLACSADGKLVIVYGSNRS